SRLDAQHRDGDVGLLGGGAAMAPDANPAMLGIAAHIPPDGKAALYVQVRQGLVGYYPVVGSVTENPAESFSPEPLERHHQFWTFERKSFEDHFPGAPKKRGGRPKPYTPEHRERVLIEAAMALLDEGVPKSLTEDELADMVAIRMDRDAPGGTLLKEILKPLYKRLKDTTRK